MTMDELENGDEAEILGYRIGNGQCRTKLLALGFTKGEKLRIDSVSLFGDMLKVTIRGYSVSIHKDEANIVKVKKI